MSGIDYEDALKKCKEVHLQRKELYGSKWRDDPPWALLAMVRQKYMRLEYLILEKKGNEYESVEDSAVDLINWALFLLQNHLESTDTFQNKLEKKEPLIKRGVVRFKKRDDILDLGKKLRRKKEICL